MNTREYTFQSLFGSSFDFEGTDIVLKNIEIPIIQRDFAQGRISEYNLRDNFLRDIYKSLDSDEIQFLDFI